MKNYRPAKSLKSRANIKKKRKKNLKEKLPFWMKLKIKLIFLKQIKTLDFLF